MAHTEQSRRKMECYTKRVPSTTQSTFGLRRSIGKPYSGPH